MAIVEETELPVRHAGRVIALDPDGRVLLFRYDDGPPNGRHWNTPGGGLEPGEDYQDGAQRELLEETGWADVSVLPGAIHHRTVVMEHSDRIVRRTGQHRREGVARRPHGPAQAAALLAPWPAAASS
jgi:8-oxo-dGTP pyrophosphatase MutT (NUDIX family)